MVQAAADKLGKNAEFINSLNVFPVPDGDTGTNMTSSMASGAKYERNETSKKVGDLSAALAKGLLMGSTRKFWGYFIADFPWLCKGNRRHGCFIYC